MLFTLPIDGSNQILAGRVKQIEGYIAHLVFFGGTVFIDSGIFGGSGTAAVGRVGN